VQISNQIGFGEAGGFSIVDGLPFSIDRWGPAGSSKVSEQWGTDAVENPLQIVALQTIYRKAFGLPPLPTLNFISQAEYAMRQSSKNGANNGSSDDSNLASDDTNESKSEENDSNETLAAVDFDIPIGWFHIGCKRDVPADACYSGCYQGRYAWVTSDGVDGLAQFTLAVLTITKLNPSESSRSGGLMVTN